jgi:hypothetical protein
MSVFLDSTASFDLSTFVEALEVIFNSVWGFFTNAFNLLLTNGFVAFFVIGVPVLMLIITIVRALFGFSQSE